LPDIPAFDDWVKSAPSGNLDALIQKHSERTGLDPDLVRRLVKQESRGKSGAVSPKGAGGTMQLMPATAANLGVKNRFDPDENIRGGTDYLKQQLDKFGDVNLALAAYNAGPGAVQKYGNKVPPYKETQDYVKKIGGGYQGTGYAGGQSPQVPKFDDWVQQTAEQPVAATAFKELNQQPRTRPKKSILSAATGGMGGGQQGIKVGGKVGQSDQATSTRAGLRGLAQMSGAPTQLLPQGAQDWINETAAQGASQLMTTGAGIARQAGPIGSAPARAVGIKAPFDRNQITRDVANQLQGGAQQIQSDVGAAQAQRGTLSRATQNLVAGSIGSAPAMILTSLGVPPAVAFGLQAELQASGRDADFKDIVKETAKGATIGALFSAPLPVKRELLTTLQAALLKAGIVGAGTAAITGSPQEAITNAAFAATGAKEGEAAPKPELTEAVPASQPREFAPTLTPSELAQRTALREQGTVPAATLPAALPERRLAETPLGPRRGPTPRAGEAPVVPEQNLSEQVGVGIQPASGDIMQANAQIDSINRRLNEVAQIKNPTGRAQRLQADLEAKLADATAARNALLDPKVQAQMEGRPLADVLAERRQNEGRMDTTEEGVSPEPITEPAAEPPHPSTRQNRRVRNVATGTKGQFKAGFKEAVTEAPATPEPTQTEVITPSQSASEVQTKPPEAVESPSPAAKSPETKPSRLAQGVEAKAVAANLTQGFADLPEYQTVKVADQAERAVKLLNDNPDLAKRIAVGTEQPPAGLLPESVFTAVENRALQQGDIQTIQDLAQGSRSVEASGMGQRIRMLAERNPNSPVKAIADIEKARSASVPKEKLAKVTNQIKTEVDVELKKSAPKIKDWSSFLESIKC
jgi:hypothetical protein